MSKHHPKHPQSAHSGSTAPTTAPQTAVASGDCARAASPEDIQLRAYRKWEQAGKPSCDGIQFWLEAEQELTHGK